MSLTVTGRTGRASFQVPEGWATEDSGRDEVEALAYLPGPDETFAPNAVLTVNDFTGTVAEFAVRTLEGISSTLVRPVIIDVLPWTPGGGLAEDPAAAGRVVVYSHLSPQTGTRLRVAEWLTAAAGAAVQLTTTTTVAQWPLFGAVFSAIADTVQVTGAGTPSAPAQGADGIPESARDPFLTRLIGTPVERIHGLATLQPYPNEGQWVHGAAMSLLSEIADGLKIGRLNALGYRDQLAELERHGLAEGRTLTEDGDTLAEFLRHPAASIRITASYGEHEPSFQAWVAGDKVLVAASTGYVAATEGKDGGQPTPDHFNVQISRLTDLSTLMAQWVGLQPAWNLPVFPMIVPDDVLARRWQGDGTYPEGANETLQEMWHENWFVWNLVAVGPRSEAGPVSYVNAGHRGHYRLGAEEGENGEGTAFVPTPSAAVYDQFEDAIQACLYGREPRHP